MPEDEKSDRENSRKVEVERDTREAMNLPNSRLHYEVTSSSQERCNPNSLQLVVENDIFCGNNRRNISERTSKII